MPWQKPEPALVWRAVTAYLTVAYGSPCSGSATPGPHEIPASTPSAVKARLESLRHAPAGEFYASPVFERDTCNASPSKFSLRLGNRHYPHMKLVIERSPHGGGYLLRADTHDAHVRTAPGSRDHAVFCQLMELNRNVADAIEATWEQQGIPTFKSFLREDLARRKRKQ
jgi:hypothetical protein